MLRKILMIGALLLTLSSYSAQAFTKLFYAMRDSDIPKLNDHYRVLKDIDLHHKKMDILVPQAYVVNSEGIVYKSVQPDFKKTAEKYRVKLMPMVTNEGFDSEKLTKFLKNDNAEKLAIRTLTNLCRKNHYYGMQIDFEHIPYQDRNAFTSFYESVSTSLHHVGCKVSIAIVPIRHAVPPSSILMKRYVYWAGAYNQKQLAKFSDFVVLMTYNQHGTTTPGPNASYALDKRAIKYALRHIPKNKIFLGIPTSSNYWTMAPTNIDISYQQVLLLQKMHDLKWRWNNKAKVHYAVFSYQDFYHYLFVEDAASYAAKVQLAKEYHLGGVAVFRLGTEDPAIYNA